MTDVHTSKFSGRLCTTQNKHEIVWKGHLCEGSNLTGPIGDNFCLWTRCGQHDVPANAATEGDIKQVDCADCRKIWNDENGQFGVGA